MLRPATRLLLTTVATVLVCRAGYGDGTPLSTARIVCSVSHASPGVPFDAGLLITLRNGWHTYGNPPGDSGMPASLTLKPPEGWHTGELRFPPTVEHTDAAGTTHVYHGRVLIPFTITPAKDARAGETVSITGTAMWLVCSDVCVPQSAELELRVRIGTGEPALTEDWKRAKGADPDSGHTSGTDRRTGTKHPETKPHTEKPQ